MLFCELQMEFYYTSLSRNIVIKQQGILTSKIICNAEISGSWVIIWRLQYKINYICNRGVNQILDIMSEFPKPFYVGKNFIENKRVRGWGRCWTWTITLEYMWILPLRTVSCLHFRADTNTTVKQQLLCNEGIWEKITRVYRLSNFSHQLPRRTQSAEGKSSMKGFKLEKPAHLRLPGWLRQ